MGMGQKWGRHVESLSKTSAQTGTLVEVGMVAL